jgi:hypothetical protein
VTALRSPTAGTAWPTLWAASEDRDVLHLRPVNGRPRTARVPKGLVHAVDRGSPSVALTTVCGRSLDTLIRFPRYSFDSAGTRASRLVSLCEPCQQLKGLSPSAVVDPGDDHYGTP